MDQMKRRRQLAFLQVACNHGPAPKIIRQDRIDAPIGVLRIDKHDRLAGGGEGLEIVFPVESHQDQAFELLLAIGELREQRLSFEFDQPHPMPLGFFFDAAIDLGIDRALCPAVDFPGIDRDRQEIGRRAPKVLAVVECGGCPAHLNFLGFADLVAVFECA